jgi:predicted dehydrogenase
MMSDFPQAASVTDLRWVVIGAGSIGRRHLRNLVQLGARDVTAVRREPRPFDGDLSRVAATAELPPARDDGRSIAVVCSPTVHHARDGAAALRAGYHVLVEKPVSPAFDGVEVLRQAAEAAGRHVMVGSCLRFHPALCALRAAVQAGRFGRVHWTAVWCGQHLADWRPNRDYRETYSASRAQGGGVLLDLIHEIDYLHWIFGHAELAWASAGDGGGLGIDVEETADLAMRFEAGPLAHVHLDALARPAVRGGVLAGDRGAARWDLLSPSLEVQEVDCLAPRPVVLPANWDLNQMYVDELIAFASVVDGSANPSPLDDGEQALRTALDARRAAIARGSVSC